MARISLSSASASADSRNEESITRFLRRIQATPPGQCPLALTLAFLEASALQTCGKCVPCRDGLPQLAALLRKISEGDGTAEDLDRLKTLAEFIEGSSDCAIGYDAAHAVLESVRRFSDEYQSHIDAKICQKGLSQSVPCETFCPAHVDVPGYIALVHEGDYAGAVNLIRKDNPFPTACAFVCEHPCEKRCRRTLIDEPINIRGIKMYAVDQAKADTVPVPRRLPDTGRRIAVVGGGPSGLTCAYYLALMGHKVVLYEARAKLGGMMRYGIPAYRFPRERLDEDIRAILKAGNIEVRLNTAVGAEKMQVLAETYDAVYVAIGAQTGKKLRMEGADAHGVSSAVDLLSKIGDDVYPDYRGKKVAVIGGGNVAMDCVRTAVRAGAEEVSLVYRRTISQMTALKEEIESAIAEGVEMLTLKAPAGIEKNANGNCRALLIEPQMISTYSRGRADVRKADKPAEKLPADIVLIAVGQDVVSAPFEAFGLKAERGIFQTDEYLRAEGFEHIFAGGDCQTGPATVIKAVGAGKAAARNIDEYLGFHHALDCGVTAPPPKFSNRTATGRITMAERPAKFRKHDFKAVEIGMSREEVLQECGRCLRCDAFGAGACSNGRVQHA